MRGRGESLSAAHARSMSSRLQRARPAMIGPCTSFAIRFTDSQSPREAIGNPASMTSTPSSASAFATRSFSGCVMLQPGDCSPSRSVVSKISTRFGSWTMIATPPAMCVRSRASPISLTASLLQPRHPLAQFRTDPLDRVLQILVHELVVLLAPLFVLRNPLASELALLDFLENLLHLTLRRGIHDPRAARKIAVLRRLADELVHLRETAFVQQVDDQLQLVQTLIVGHFRLISRLDERLETLDDELGRATA